MRDQLIMDLRKSRPMTTRRQAGYRAAMRTKLGKSAPYLPDGVDELPRGAGVYLLRNTITGDTYVGGSLRIWSRIRTHFFSPLSPVQPLVKKFGPKSFAVEVLSLCAPRVVGKREIYWYEKLKPSLNRARPLDMVRPDPARAAELLLIEERLGTAKEQS